MASGQMPSMATISSDTTAPMAIARLANCHASRPSSATMASVGTLSSRLSTQVKVPSMGPRTVWKKGRKFSTTQPRPWLIQLSIGSEPSHSWLRCRPLVVLSRSGLTALAGASSQLSAPPASRGWLVVCQGSASTAAAGGEAMSQGDVLVAASVGGVEGVAQGLVSTSGGSVVPLSVPDGARRVSFMRSFGVNGRQRPWWPVRGQRVRWGCHGPETSARWSC